MAHHYISYHHPSVPEVNSDAYEQYVMAQKEVAARAHQKWNILEPLAEVPGLMARTAAAVGLRLKMIEGDFLPANIQRRETCARQLGDDTPNDVLKKVMEHMGLDRETSLRELLPALERAVFFEGAAYDPVHNPKREYRLEHAEREVREQTEIGRFLSSGLGFATPPVNPHAHTYGPVPYEMPVYANEADAAYGAAPFVSRALPEDSSSWLKRIAPKPRHRPATIIDPIMEEMGLFPTVAMAIGMRSRGPREGREYGCVVRSEQSREILARMLNDGANHDHDVLKEIMKRTGLEREHALWETMQAVRRAIAKEFGYSDLYWARTFRTPSTERVLDSGEPAKFIRFINTGSFDPPAPTPPPTRGR